MTGKVHKEKFEIATGGDPQSALVTALALRIPRGTVADVAVAHDDGCPCQQGQPMPYCTCEIVGLIVTTRR